MKNLKKSQLGVSFIGVLFFGGILVFLGIVGAQVLPTLIEYQAINKAVEKAKASGSTPEIKSTFDKAAQIDDIKSVVGKDLVITKEGDKTVVAFAYSKEIHLAGPAYLLIKYSGSSK